MTNWVRSDEPDGVFSSLPMRSWALSVHFATVTVIKPPDFYRIREKRGGAAELLNSSHQRGLPFSLFLFFMAQCIVKDLLKNHPPSLCPTWGVRRGRRSRRLPANGSICPPPAGCNGPIKCKRFKPNRYSVNVISLRWGETHKSLDAPTKSHCKLLFTWK